MLPRGRDATIITISILRWRHNGARWRLKSPASPLLTQPFNQVQIKENIKAPRHCPLARGIHRWPVNSPHKWPVTQKMFPWDDVIMDEASCPLRFLQAPGCRLHYFSRWVTSGQRCQANLSRPDPISSALVTATMVPEVTPHHTVCPCPLTLKAGSWTQLGARAPAVRCHKKMQCSGNRQAGD